MSSEPNRIAQVAADGRDGPVDEETLRQLKEAAASWAQRAELYWQDNLANQQTRYCQWTGQSPDGRLRSEYLNADPEPFDGASDQRIRWADSLILETVRFLTVALARAQIRVEPRGPGDQPAAETATRLLRWMVDRLGVDWWRQHGILLNYLLQDSPAVAAMLVQWERRTELELQTLTLDELQAIYMQSAMAALPPPTDQRAAAAPEATAPEAATSTEAAAVGPESVESVVSVPPEAAPAPEAEAAPALLQVQAWGRFLDAVQAAPADEDQLAVMILEYFPDIKPARARRAAQDLRRHGQAEWPVPRVTFEGPTIRALRFGADFVIPDNTTSFDRASPWFVHEWLTETQLRGRVATDGWDRAWVESVLAHEGESVWPTYSIDPNGFLAQVGYEQQRGRYQVLWAYFEALNEDDVPARYCAVIRPDCEGTAFGRRMLRDRHGSWPAVFFQREVLDSYLLNSRGIPELVGPAQGIVKLLQDVETDAANIGGLPPITSTEYDNKGQIYLEPLKHFPLRRDGTLKFMQPPAFPATIEATLKRLVQQRDEYWGRVNPELKNEAAAGIAVEHMVGAYFAGVRRLLSMMLSLAQQHASPELLARVADAEPTEPERSTARELQGEYDVRLVFQAADLDAENVTARMTSLRDVLLAVDRDKTIDTTPVVQYAFRVLFPHLGEDALRPVDRAARDEMRDEIRNYVHLRAGIVPEMDTAGTWNYGLRLQFWDRLLQSDPAVLADLAPEKQARIQEWIKALQHQQEQFGANVETGRAGAKLGDQQETPSE